MRKNAQTDLFSSLQMDFNYLTNNHVSALKTGDVLCYYRKLLRGNNSILNVNADIILLSEKIKKRTWGKFQPMQGSIIVQAVLLQNDILIQILLTADRQNHGSLLKRLILEKRYIISGGNKGIILFAVMAPRLNIRPVLPIVLSLFSVRHQ